MKLPGQEGKTAAVVGTVTEDAHAQEVPTLKVCTLRVSSPAGSCLLKAGAKILTLDQLALDSPKGNDTVLLSGPYKGPEVVRHFSKAPGTPHQCTKPCVGSKGWKFEHTRGHLASPGYMK
ncbi:60S ribosomal protein L18-like [Artibeus jamaicensis]|uniref:60S ribosomal protein L18-like n=1 Tax=Artibeus jamaicensis TaxID=9417 RepID=UPI00235AF0E2|nr:60S ribosomal protein L18-like [Artibeus jamaicensis]